MLIFAEMVAVIVGSVVQVLKAVDVAFHHQVGELSADPHRRRPASRDR